MSWMPVSNAPMQGVSSSLDIQGLSDSFRDGQKLRQEYEARQQQKALNEIMKVGDHNGRLELAQQHKYAGALVPLLQKYDEDRQKAALDNLKASADIGKVYGETSKLGAEVGKLGAETGEIGAKTTGLVRENTAGIQNDISALAVTQNPKLFALGIGEMVKQGLINPERADMMLKMVATDQPNAAAVLQAMVMANPELAKLFKPESKTLDAKDGSYLYSTNSFTGEANKPTAKIAYGRSPDNVADNDTRRYVSDNSLAGTQYSSDNTYEASVYGTNVRSGDSRYATNVASQDRQLKLGQDGKIEWAKISQEQQKLDNPQANRNQIPPSAMKTMGELQEKLVSNAQTMTENGKWMKRLQSGELQLGAVQNFGNTAAARTGITSLGSNPEAYAEFNAYIKDLANKALRLNAGVQTDADYKRQLEAIVSGGGIPKNNGIAFGLLNRIHKDFDSQNRGIYQNLASYKKEYAGISVPAYSQNRGKTSNNKPAETSAGQAIGKKVFGGG